MIAADPTSQPVTLQVEERRRSARRRLFVRAGIQVGVFVVAYLITASAALIGVIVAVRPDNVLALVLLTLFSAVLFVVVFAGMRYVALHHLVDLYPDKDEDPGQGYHIGKSVMYAILALILAALFTGLLLNTATATPLNYTIT